MSTHAFYCENLPLSGGTCVLSREEALHAVRVMRLGEGDAIRLLDGQGRTAEAVVEGLARRDTVVTCRVHNVSRAAVPRVRVRLYIAPPKGRNMETLIRSAVELGVWRVSPVLCAYSVSRPDGGKDGWRKVAVAACKQSGNPWLPTFDEPVPFSEALSESVECGFYGAVPRAGAALPSLPSEEALRNGAALWVGPEGGFSDKEAEALTSRAIPVTVGSHILRVETAVPALLAALSIILKDK